MDEIMSLPIADWRWESQNARGLCRRRLLAVAGWLRCKSRRSRRMTIAHRFIGGCQGRGFNESVKRTTDDKRNANELFSRPLHGLDHIRVSKPSAKALGYIGGCQGRGFNEAVKRTTDDKPNANELFSRPLHGLDHIRVSKPSA